jgi:hypothetical protein
MNWKYVYESNFCGRTITTAVLDIPPSRPTARRKPTPRAFDIAALLREPLAHPCPRFPAWALSADGRPWPLLDRHIGEIVARSCEPEIHRLTIFNHALTAQYLTGATEMHYGFSEMPRDVREALRGGEMRALAQLAGWREISFGAGGAIESVLGCDGLRLFFDEDGREVIATQFLGGEVEMVKGGRI